VVNGISDGGILREPQGKIFQKRGKGFEAFRDESELIFVEGRGICGVLRSGNAPRERWRFGERHLSGYRRRFGERSQMHCDGDERGVLDSLVCSVMVTLSFWP
jgi:hypothetical protein